MRTRILLFSLVLMVIIATPVMADTISFSVNYSDGLTHGTNYVWGINWTLPAGQTITSATLTITGLHNWDGGTSSDTLAVYFLDTAATGFNTHSFSGALLQSITNIPINTPMSPQVIPLASIYFDQMKSPNAVPNFGIGLDPNCHFYFTELRIDIHTSSVPEPSTLSLLGLGILGALGFTWRRHNK